jgi:UDP-galactopyranose mutase
MTENGYPATNGQKGDAISHGPFPSRAPPPWCDLNKVTDICGKDRIHDSGVKDDAPLQLPKEVRDGDLASAPAKVDLLIVGAGLSGAVIAERCSKELGMTSLMIDSRDHIGGNCYDFVEEHGIRVSKYGAHLFHTKYERVWEYVNRFSQWMPYDHRVRGRVPDRNGVKRLVPIPPVQATVNALFGENIQSEEEMQAWYDKKRVPCSGEKPANSEEASLSRVGAELYEAIFKHYTKKQWDKYPSELDASVMLRLPCRTSTDERYFGDDWQALPLRGYTRIFENMLLDDPNITVRLGVDYFKAREDKTLPEYGMLVYTGPIDSYFAQLGMPKLEYRSLRFEEEYVEEPKQGYFQEAMVVNYPSPDVNFTRIVEYKHVPNQTEAVKAGKVPGTLIAREYSSAEGDPYYPVPNPENTALYEKYRALAEKEENVCFVGRLASYKYFNMDQAILNALEIYDNMKEHGRLEPKRRPEDFGPGDGPK